MTGVVFLVFFFSCLYSSLSSLSSSVCYWHLFEALYTWGEVTPQSLWPRYDRHFVGITRYNALESNGEDYSCYSNRIESVSLRKCPFIITDLPSYQQSVFKWQTFVRVFTYKMAAKSTGEDMEQNYVTVTLCIHYSVTILRCIKSELNRTELEFWTRSWVRESWVFPAKSTCLELEFSLVHVLWTRLHCH